MSANLEKRTVILLLSIFLLILLIGTSIVGNVAKRRDAEGYGGGSKLTTTIASSIYRSAPQSIRVSPIPQDADIIFISARHLINESYYYQVYTAKEDGSDITRITYNNHDNQHAAVSYNRRFIAVARKPGEVWIMDTAMQWEWQLLPDFYIAGSGGVDWDRNGYVYFSAKSSESSIFNIYKVKYDGSSMQEIVADNFNKYDVSVSEDNRMIAYNKLVPRIDGTPTSEIWVANTDGSNQRRVTIGSNFTYGWPPFPPGHYDPEISSDNLRIIYGATSNNPNNCFSIQTLCDSPSPLGAYNVWIVDINGGNKRKLTNNTGVETIPDWYNGKIMFTDHNQNGEDNNNIGFIGIIIMNEDGSNKKIIVKGNYPDLYLGGRHGKFIPK